MALSNSVLIFMWQRYFKSIFTLIQVRLYIKFILVTYNKKCPKPKKKIIIRKKKYIGQNIPHNKTIHSTPSFPLYSQQGTINIGRTPSPSSSFFKTQRWQRIDTYMLTSERARFLPPALAICIDHRTFTSFAPQTAAAGQTCLRTIIESPLHTHTRATSKNSHCVHNAFALSRFLTW